MSDPRGNTPDPAIIEYGSPTDAQAEKIRAWIELGSASKAGKSLGMNKCSVIKAKQAVQKRAEAAGWSPAFDATGHVPSTEEVIGRSVYTTDDHGNKIWLKTKKIKELEKETRDSFIEGLKADITPCKKKPLAKSVKHDPDLLSTIVMGDSHNGMLALGSETRHSDFDTNIASRTTREAIDNLVDRSPSSKTGMLVEVGDYTHQDSSHNTTFAGTSLDVDTRYHKVLRAGAMTMRYTIDRMLDKFKEVVVCIAKGNHSPDTAVAIQLMLEFYYSEEPRVTILDTEGFFHYWEFGDWLFGCHHGDKVKPQKLVSVMARDMKEAWGRTSSRLWFVGHFHHDHAIELDGCKVRKFGTLAPPDGWHASHGFSSESTMELITFKKDGGTHSTLVYNIPQPIQQPDIRIGQ